jgi:hypothetical protein
MASLKLFLASLGLGLCIPASVVVFILVLKIIFPGMTGIFLLWFFVWPMPFILRLVPDLAGEKAALLAFVIGLLVDVGFFSFIAYWGLRGIHRSRMRRLRRTVPPPPPTF